MKNEASAAYLIMGIAHPEWQTRLCLGIDQLLAAPYDPTKDRLWAALSDPIKYAVKDVLARREAGERGQSIVEAADAVLSRCSLEPVP